MNISEPSQTSKMELLAKKRIQAVNYFYRKLNLWLGPEKASVFFKEIFIFFFFEICITTHNKTGHTFPQNFPKNGHFLTSDTYTTVCVWGGKKC